MTTHFRERVAERGPAGIDPEGLAEMVKAAVLGGDDAIAERVFDGRHPGTGVYRLHMGDHGRFYAICDDPSGRPITFLTQGQIKALKAAVRGRAKCVRHALDEAQRKEWARDRKALAIRKGKRR